MHASAADKLACENYDMLRFVRTKIREKNATQNPTKKQVKKF